jgi:mRNA-degrading endonuclease YafQ of YafQ-DinJ toxin-antitoxin module
MQILPHKKYDKAWKKLSAGQQQKVLAALKLFLADPDNSLLRLHQLKGEYYPQYSLSVGGDTRIHFLKIDEDTIVLMLVGTHSQLYG